LNARRAPQPFRKRPLWGVVIGRTLQLCAGGIERPPGLLAGTAGLEVVDGWRAERRMLIGDPMLDAVGVGGAGSLPPRATLGETRRHRTDRVAQPGGCAGLKRVKRGMLTPAQL
jgi:hypothetical protein